MNAWQQWVHRPQHLWVRRALFQVHLWIGIGIGLYIVLVSVSGSAIVYRPQLVKAFARQENSVAVSGARLNDRALTQRAQQAYIGFEVESIFQSRRPDRPATVLLKRGNKHISRLFNPYTGEDLGDPTSPMENAVDWLVDFHDNLLSGPTGRFWNGIGSILVTLTSLTGLILWWPGIKNWRRSTVINWKAKFPLFNWTLHSAIGFWCSAIVLMWGFSGIYFIFPAPFDALFGNSQFLFWLARLHFGRFGRIGRATWFDWSLSMLWVVFGLIPVVLAVTGFLMWWNRVLRKKGPSTGLRESIIAR
ncbi:MAG TPA: PepSY-associated TM helix domain-containing protein [Candidatus Acidoferrales bacterium]|nr:PepSY-associated TM helix domain-containing protein [Candidatus Acidoferrales bacterium]